MTGLTREAILTSINLQNFEKCLSGNAWIGNPRIVFVPGFQRMKLVSCLDPRKYPGRAEPGCIRIASCWPKLRSLVVSHRASCSHAIVVSTDVVITSSLVGEDCVPLLLPVAGGRSIVVTRRALASRSSSLSR